MIHRLSREPRVQRLNQRCVFGDVAQLSACFESRVAYFNPSRFRASLYLRQTWHVFTVNEGGIRKITPAKFDCLFLQVFTNQRQVLGVFWILNRDRLGATTYGIGEGMQGCLETEWHDLSFPLCLSRVGHSRHCLLGESQVRVSTAAIASVVSLRRLMFSFIKCLRQRLEGGQDGAAFLFGNAFKQKIKLLASRLNDLLGALQPSLGQHQAHRTGIVGIGLALEPTSSLEQSNQTAGGTLLEPQSGAEFLLGQSSLTAQFSDGVRFRDADWLSARGLFWLLEAVSSDEGDHAFL